MPSGITIIGLGPGSSQQWTRAAFKLLSEANEIYLRTAAHPSASDLTAPVIHTFDDLTLQQIAAKVVRLGKRDTGVFYAVPGHPNLGEPTVPLIQNLAHNEEIPVTIVAGLNFIEPALTAAGAKTSGILQLVDADTVAAHSHPPLEPDRPALISNLSSVTQAEQVQQCLLNAYPDEFELTLVQSPGTAAERIRRCPLNTLKNQPHLDTPTSIYLPAGTRNNFSTFQETIARLRAPDGCPWDREQTHRSLRPYLLEETYEVLEALDADDPAALAEELGDLLLQIALHTQVAIDHGEFKMGDVIDHINRKLLRRHPHVFGDVVVNGVEDVATNWDAIKKEEKAAKGQANSTASALDGVPPALPALTQAMAISKRAVRVGFEWPNIEGVLEKVIEEAHEIVEAGNPVHLESEFGDLLFSVVNLARWRKIDPESALRSTNARFTRRFKKLETLAAAQGKRLPEMSIEEMDALWEVAKKDEKNG